MGKASNSLRVGDIVVNGWASPGVNDLHIVTGKSSRKTSVHTSGMFYTTRCLLKDKLTSEHLFDVKDNRLEKIGHYDYDKQIAEEMRKAYATSSLKETPKNALGNQRRV